jgi:pyruvate formate lyase activating enzyme
MKTLAQLLAEHTCEAELYRPLERNRVQCFACGLNCPIPSGFAGVCKVRYNRNGKLYAPAGYFQALHCDPIEKKPFFHALPGTRALSFGMLGCNLHCGYCQNWISSQALRDIRSILDFQPVSAEALAGAALAAGAASIVSTYNEPLITAEWAVAVFREAKAAGLATAFVSNGNATPEVLEYLRPWVDLYKVDLKSFRNEGYRELGGRIGPVLDSIRRIHRLGFWLEVVTLIVPGFNDSESELSAMAEFLAQISPDIPWHLTAFRGSYKMTDQPDTSAEALLRAAAIGRSAGLRYIYAGNLPGGTQDLENTRCPSCSTLLIERRGFRVLRNLVCSEGRCPQCAADIPGRWNWNGIPRHRDEGAELLHVRCG